MKLMQNDSLTKKWEGVITICCQESDQHGIFITVESMTVVPPVRISRIFFVNDRTIAATATATVHIIVKGLS
jgi:hypothetical protein